MSATAAHTPPVPVSVPLLALTAMGLLILSGGLAADVVLAVRLALRPPDWSSRLRRLRERAWSGMDCLALGAFLLVAHAVLLTAWRLYRLLDTAGADAALLLPALLQTAVFHGSILLGTVWILRRRGRAFAPAFGLNRGGALRRMLLGAGFYLAAMPLVALSGFAFRYLLETCGYEVEPQFAIRLFTASEHHWSLRWALGLLAVALAPFAEEVLFRGIALPFLLRRTGVLLAISAASLVFAAMHLHLPSLIPLLVISMAFTLGYLYSGSLLVPVTMHVLFNGVTLLAVFLHMADPSLESLALLRFFSLPLLLFIR